MTVDRDLNLDTALELTFDADGNLELTSGVDLVVQYMRQTLHCARGEWPWDQSFGVPYRSEILGRGRDIGAVSARIRAIIASVPDVNRVIPPFVVSLDTNARKLTVDAQVDTVYGPVSFEF